MFKNKVEPVSELLNNFHVWGHHKYVLEPRLKKPGLKILEWVPRIQRGINMGFVKFYST